MYLWPGLAQAWLRGSWVGLALAVGFTALGNVLLAATLVWDQWLPDRSRWIALAALAAIWGIAWIDARADWRRLIAEWTDGASAHGDPEARSDQWFRHAQAAYLAGDWVSAEQTLLRLLRHDARDVESRLMLATLWRHEGHLDKASRELDRLECLESAAPWRYEIARERERICAACVKTMPTGAPSDASGGGSTVAPSDDDAQIATTNRRMAA